MKTHRGSHKICRPNKVLRSLSLLLAVPFFIATAAGARYFHGASDELYRRIAYAIITVAALVILPLFDHWLH